MSKISEDIVLRADEDFIQPYGTELTEALHDEACKACGVRATTAQKIVLYRHGHPEPLVYCSYSCILDDLISEGVVSFEDAGRGV